MKTKQMVKIAIDEASKMRGLSDMTEAKQVFGCLAITWVEHRRGKKSWRITHLPTGVLLCRPNSLKQARKMLGELGGRSDIAQLTLDSGVEWARCNPRIVDYLRCQHHDDCSLAEFLEMEDCRSAA